MFQKKAKPKSLYRGERRGGKEVVLIHVQKKRGKKKTAGEARTTDLWAQRWTFYRLAKVPGDEKISTGG